MSDVSATTTTRRTGRVKFFDSRKGWGYIKPDDGSNDVFISVNQLPKDCKSLTPDQPCSYEQDTGKKGIFAKELRLL